MQAPVLRHLNTALSCLLAQCLCSALITLHWNQQTKGLVDADLFDVSAGAYLLLEVARIEGKMLGRASLESLLLIGVALPLLVLCHLRLLKDCAKNCCPSGSLLARPVLDAFGSALLIHSVRAAANLGCTWLVMRASLALLSDLNAGVRLHVLVLLGLCSVTLVFAWAILGVVSDHTQLSGLLAEGQRPGLRKRLSMAFMDSFTTKLVVFRLARLLSSLMLAAVSVLVYRGQASSLLSNILVQGLILLSILVEAWWYRALAQRILSDRLRPWLTCAS